jgi:hypothetical protein
MHGQLNLNEYHVDKRQASVMTTPQVVCIGTAGAHDHPPPFIFPHIIALLTKPLGYNSPKV